MSSLIDTIIAFGYVALFLAVFVESGVFGFFLPGDTLLFTAGLFAARGQFNIIIICLGCFVAAILGVQVGYWIGAKFGKRLYKEQDSFFFRQSHLEKTRAFYRKYGKSTIILARFTPIVRTFAPLVAGLADMDYPTFVRYNLIGGFIWAVIIPLLGFWLGQVVPNIDRYLLPILAVVLVTSFLPAIWHVIQEKRAK